MPQFGESGAAELWVLFLLVLGDSLWVPVPGDSALIIAGGLAAKGTIGLPEVIIVASVAAFIGDAIAFHVGRRGGRRVLERDGRHAVHRRELLARADRFYARYGVIAVYVAKFVPGVRAVSAVAAGATTMSRTAFLVVDALACISWTTLTASVAYAVGPTGSLFLVGAGLVALVVGFAVAQTRRRRVAIPG
jgi:membrane protein DedA with SNARE-associated domain